MMMMMMMVHRSADYGGYSKPFLVLDIIWNLAFVLVSVFVLLITVREKPSTPLRVWICGYALQCLLHVGFVYLECQRRHQSHSGFGLDGFPLSESRSRYFQFSVAVPLLSLLVYLYS